MTFEDFEIWGTVAVVLLIAYCIVESVSWQALVNQAVASLPTPNLTQQGN